MRGLGWIARRWPTGWGAASVLLELLVNEVKRYLMIVIPPKYAVSQVVGYIKVKSAIQLARAYGERRRNFVGQHFWAREFFVSTVGRNEAVVREYIRNQE